MKYFLQLFIYSIAVLFTVQTAQAQVSISPTAVFLDRGSNVGSFYVSNPSTSPVEVQLSFEFAYPQTDDQGNVRLNYEDTEAEENFSLKPYLRAFPTTFVLQPDERQTVRLLGRIPADADNAMYWTRMRVSSSQLTPPIGEAAEGGVAAQVSFQIDQVTAVFARKGDVSTNLTIHNLRTSLENDQLTVLADVERGGNAPFIGSVRTRVTGPNGNVVAERRSATSVYFRNNQKVEFQTADWPAGQYSVETSFESQRNDISSRHLIQIPTVTERTTFTIE